MSFLRVPLLQILVKPLRKVGEIDIKVVLNESATDVLTITKQPVQQGASISDHSYKEPTVLSMSVYFGDNFGVDLGQVYKSLLDLQSSRIPFDVVTPKRIYKNMLMASLSQTTDKNTENTLAVLFTFHEVIIVTVATTQVPRGKQRNAGATGVTENAGKKSALLTLKEGIGGLIGN